MKNPKSALRGDHASAMMLLGGELQDATGAPFGMGKNPKTVYLPENTHPD
jgi:hypothetical protein